MFLEVHDKPECTIFKGRIGWTDYDGIPRPGEFESSSATEPELHTMSSRYLPQAMQILQQVGLSAYAVDELASMVGTESFMRLKKPTLKSRIKRRRAAVDMMANL